MSLPSVVLAASAAVFAFTTLPGPAAAFVPSSARASIGGTVAKKSKSSLPALPELLLSGVLDGVASSSDAPLTAADYARQEFWFYFFAGSGAGGIGIAQLPSMFKEADSARATAGTGPTLGGDELDAGPLVKLYYQSDISSADVADAVSKAPTAEYISGRSTAANYMAQKGYIVQADFLKEMDAKKCNPLASYAVFDAISSGKGGVVSPIEYDNKISAYRDEIGATGGVAGSFGGDLNKFLAVKVGAFVGLVFCLLVDFGFVASAGYAGFLS